MPARTLTLPIRLVPVRRVVAGHAILCLAFLGFGLWGMQARLGRVAVADVASAIALSTTDALLLLAMVLSVAATIGLFTSLLKLLPGSPFQHLGIRHAGLRVRGFLGSAQFTWDELSAFAPRDRARDEHWGGDHSVIAFWACETEMAEEGRFEPAIALQIDAGRYGHDWGRNNGDALAGWLNELRELHALGQLEPREALIIPDAFHRSAVAERSPRSMQPAAVPDPRNPARKPAAVKPKRPQTIVRR